MATVNIPLELETICWCCNESGVSERASDNDETGKCTYCEGIGYIRTNFGDAVLDFMKRHGAAK